MHLPITLLIDRQQPLARLLCRGDIVALTLCANGQLLIERQDGTQAQASVEPETTLFTRLVILRLRMANKAESIVLTRGALGEAGLRRLRVWLTWRASAVA